VGKRHFKARTAWKEGLVMCENTVKGAGIMRNRDIRTGRELASIQNWFVIFIYSKEIELRRA
jgi:hypothetical protein